MTVLGSVGSAEAKPQLQELSAEKDSAIASAANEALRRLNARVH
jgi:hypothetical protein